MVFGGLVWGCFCRIPSPGDIEIPERWGHRNVVHSGRAEASEVGTAFEQVAWTTLSQHCVAGTAVGRPAGVHLWKTGSSSCADAPQ